MRPALAQAREQAIGHALQGQTDAALTVLQDALAQPGLTEAERGRLLLDRAQVHGRAGRQRALDDDALAAAALPGPHQEKAIDFAWGLVLRQAEGGWLVPLERARELLRSAPLSPTARAREAESLLGMARFGDARESARQALAVHPEQPIAREIEAYVTQVLGYRWPAPAAITEPLVGLLGLAEEHAEPEPAVQQEAQQRLASLEAELGELRARLGGVTPPAWLEPPPALTTDTADTAPPAEGELLPLTRPAAAPAGRIDPRVLAATVEGARLRWQERAWWLWVARSGTPSALASLEALLRPQLARLQWLIDRASGAGPANDLAPGLPFVWLGLPVDELRLHGLLNAMGDRALPMGICLLLRGDPAGEPLLVSGGLPPEAERR